MHSSYSFCWALNRHNWTISLSHITQIAVVIILAPTRTCILIYYSLFVFFFVKLLMSFVGKLASCFTSKNKVMKFKK